MITKSTMPEMWRDLMDIQTIRAEEHPYCCVCGKSGHVAPLNRHHIVPRSAGNLIANGHSRRKPTVPLCGRGNATGCHGMAHSGRLHFRNHDGELEYLVCEPCDRLTALSMDGWRHVR